jgi:hypothetical protein
MKFLNLFALLFVTSLVPLEMLVPDRLLAQEAISWTTTASNFQNKLDQNFRLTCPPNGSIGSLWGTDIYTSDSSICTAAVHSGLFSARDGGRVTIRIRPGAEFYNGTTRNGVTSSRYGSYRGSFIFLGANGQPLLNTPQVMLINWNETASNWENRLEQDFTFDCPPNGSIGSLWGTDIYTSDSSICTAAVHSGLFSARDGGRVTIRIRPGAEFYNGTTRNGITSSRYGSYRGSFIFTNR